MAPGGVTVLVCDDEPSLRLLCRVNLEMDGYRVLEAATLADARAVLEREPVAVLILDVHVGADDGLDLLDELRAAESSVRVVLLTGTDVVGRGRDADRVLAKPFEPTDLLAAVASLTNGDVEAHVDSIA